jgi:hypothetical protein
MEPHYGPPEESLRDWHAVLKEHLEHGHLVLDGSPSSSALELLLLEEARVEDVAYRVGLAGGRYPADDTVVDDYERLYHRLDAQFYLNEQGVLANMIKYGSGKLGDAVRVALCSQIERAVEYVHRNTLNEASRQDLTSALYHLNVQEKLVYPAKWDPRRAGIQPYLRLSVRRNSLPAAVVESHGWHWLRRTKHPISETSIDTIGERDHPTAVEPGYEKVELIDEIESITGMHPAEMDETLRSRLEGHKDREIAKQQGKTEQQVRSARATYLKHLRRLAKPQ